MILKLAWRNLWRNRRRTMITLASVLFAVLLSTVMMSAKEGMYEGMIDSQVGSFMGYAQIHANGYWDDKNLENSLEINDTLRELLETSPALDSYLTRVESFALSASEDQTRPAVVIGTDVEKEAEFHNLDQRVSKGEYLQAGEKAVLLGDGLAQSLGLDVGDTLVLLGQGYHEVNAAGKYHVKGLVKFGAPDLSKRLVFMPVSQAQELYATEGRLTNIVLFPKNRGDTEALTTQLRSEMGTSYEAMTWQDLNPELVKMIETDRSEGYALMMILYMVVGFGIFGTSLMMLAERKHEFGVLVALGMKRVRLAIVVWIEVVIVSILGAIAGMIGAFPICYYFNVNPIEFGEDMSKVIEEYGMEASMKFSISPDVFTQQTMVVFIIACVISLYPLIKLMRIDAIKAMRS